jgi:hypothetical protein
VAASSRSFCLSSASFPSTSSLSDLTTQGFFVLLAF